MYLAEHYKHTLIYVVIFAPTNEHGLKWNTLSLTWSHRPIPSYPLNVKILISEFWPSLLLALLLHKVLIETPLHLGDKEVFGSDVVKADCCVLCWLYECIWCVLHNQIWFWWVQNFIQIIVLQHISHLNIAVSHCRGCLLERRIAGWGWMWL